MTRISLGGTSFAGLPPPEPAARRAPLPGDVQLQTVLFGAQTPTIIDLRSKPHLLEAMRWLRKQKLRCAIALGARDEDYTLEACVGQNACIDKNGTIYMGEYFLERAQDQPDLVLGVLAHEVGHQPKQWVKLTGEYPDLSALPHEQLAALARREEAKADAAAGKILAAMRSDPSALCEFLMRHGDFERGRSLTLSHYDPASRRVEVITQSHRQEAERLEQQRKLYPDVARAKDVRTLQISSGSAAPKVGPKKRRVLGKA